MYHAYYNYTECNSILNTTIK